MIPKYIIMRITYINIKATILLDSLTNYEFKISSNNKSILLYKQNLFKNILVNKFEKVIKEVLNLP
jgi:hypothetical protein